MLSGNKRKSVLTASSNVLSVEYLHQILGGEENTHSTSATAEQYLCSKERMNRDS